MEKLLFIYYINEKQLKGNNICEAIICKKNLEIYDDLTKDTNNITSNESAFKASKE